MNSGRQFFFLKFICGWLWLLLCILKIMFAQGEPDNCSVGVYSICSYLFLAQIKKISDAPKIKKKQDF